MGSASQGFQLFTHRTTPDAKQPRCPRCKSYDVRRSGRRNFIDVVLELMDLAPYRCRSCRRLFHNKFCL
jgi:transposase-like protein